MGISSGAGQNRSMAEPGGDKQSRGESSAVISENEFQTIFEQGYQEGWGAGFIPGLVIGCGLAGVLTLGLLLYLH